MSIHKCFARYHNTISAYMRAGCRCPETMELMRAKWRARNRRRRASKTRVPREHGLVIRSRERQEEALKFLRAGRSVHSTAFLMGMSRRQVQRYYTALVKEGKLVPHTT